MFEGMTVTDLLRAPTEQLVPGREASPPGSAQRTRSVLDTSVLIADPGCISCFGDEDAPGLGRLARLEATIAERAAADPSESWTARLLAEGVKRVAQKVGEEGVETALAGVAGPDSELASEAADLVYHLMVLLRARHMVFQDVLDVLAQRAEAARHKPGPAGT